MSPLDKLIAHFEKFPGTGLRQAKRFAFHVLTLPPTDVKELAELINTISNSVTECTDCHRYFSESGQNKTCRICRDESRDATKLLVVARDSDIDAIERSRVYDGYYFVLGGTVPLLTSPESSQKVRAGSLKRTVEVRSGTAHLNEVILAFSINPDGENTSRFVESVLTELSESKKIKISYLGRGLSTGSELEYADPETIKNALQGRSDHH